jgi:hypothetical protein
MNVRRVRVEERFLDDWMFNESSRGLRGGNVISRYAASNALLRIISASATRATQAHFCAKSRVADS